MNTRGLLWFVGLAVVAGAGIPARAQEPQRRQVFRSNADLVTVPVFVKGSGGRVAGLKPADFLITDNGVAQRVDGFTTEALPVDVTVLVENSHALKDYAKSVNKQVEKIASLVHPGDRLEILGIDDYVHVLLPMGPPDRPFDVEAFPRGGLTSVNDALVAALLRESDPDRQHLILAITDGVDTMSALPMTAVRDVARTSGATLYLSWVSLAVGSSPRDGSPPTWHTTSERVNAYIRGASGRTVPRRQQWTPHYDPRPGRTIFAFDPLREAAEATGGSLRIGGFIERNASIIFEKFYAEFRRTYVLQYRPEVVRRDGWHEVTVTVPRYPRLDIRARHGYFVETEPPIVNVPEVVAPRAGSIEALIDAATYGGLPMTRTAVADAERAGTLGRLIADFRAAGNIWPTTPRREFVTALVLADRAVVSPDQAVVQAGIDLIARYRPLVRPPLGPDDFARLWSSAADTLLGPTRGASIDESLADLYGRIGANGPMRQ